MLATITVPSLIVPIVRGDVFSCNSIEEFETPRTVATEFIKSVFRTSKFDSVTPSNVISVVIFVTGGALVVVLVVIFVVVVTVAVVVVVVIVGTVALVIDVDEIVVGTK